MAAATRAEEFDDAGRFASEVACGPGEARAARSLFEATKRERLGFVERAVARIAQGDGADAALREVGAFVLDLLTLVERDPGLELAADDLYDAAALLADGAGRGSGMADARRWRLLKDAERRFRARLDAAHPNDRARRLGLG
ncbi:MAG TPA: hypothetical protein VF601_22570 [Beijerinckiaceae bacterium]|jgi:hypothetical protein